MAGRGSDGWIVLRAPVRATLGLAKSLSDAGFIVWTPVEIQVCRAPRKRTTAEREVPILPTYIFARACHLTELADLSESPTRQFRDFSIFHHQGRVPVIADDSLNGLRDEEGKATRRQQEHVRRQRGKRKGESFEPGETVRIGSGSFAGMDGCVAESDSRFTTVQFGGLLRLKISTFILRDDNVSEGNSPILGVAA